MDDALIELSSKSQKFQLIHSIACVILWGVGNQFFYSIPFYQAYPKLNCFDHSSNPIENCDHKMVCKLEFKGSYEIDWKDQASLQNWMTDLDLMCEEPYLIGLIGGIVFITSAVGSLTVT